MKSSTISGSGCWIEFTHFRFRLVGDLMVVTGGHEVPLEVDVVRVVLAAAPVFVGPFPGETGRHGWRCL